MSNLTVIKIGKYILTISDRHLDKVEISIPQEGEGGQFSESELEEFIDQFYKEKF